MHDLRIYAVLVLAAANPSVSDILEPLPAVPQDIPDHETDKKAAQPYALPLASPERSSVDEDQFNMAASYLKTQFSIPHHLVPSYQDTASWWPHAAQDRIRRLPNLKNHQLDSDSDFSFTDYEYIDTSNEFQLEEDKRYKRRPDLDYAWAQEKDPGKKVYKTKEQKTREPTKSKPTRKPLRGRKRPKHNQNLNRQRFPRNPSQFQNFGPQRGLPIPQVPKNLNFIAAMTSQLRNSLSNALTGTRRHTTYPLGVKAGYLRKHLQLGLAKRKAFLNTGHPEYEDFQDNRIPDNRKPDNRIPDNRIPDNRKPDNRENRITKKGLPDNWIPHKRLPEKRLKVNRIPDKRQNRAPDKWIPGGRSSLATRPSQGVLSVGFPDRQQQNRGNRGHGQGRQNNKKKRKRKRKGHTQGRLNNTKAVSIEKNGDTKDFKQEKNSRRQDTDDEEVVTDAGRHTGNYFDGLELDFWEEDTETATKPDYRTRWKDLDNLYNDNENKGSVSIDEMNKEEEIGSRRILEEENDNKEGGQFKNDASSENGKIGWGEKMWREIGDDWNGDGENWKKYKVRKKKKEKPNDDSETDQIVSDTEIAPVSDEGARYLSAWADAGEILEPKAFKETKTPVEVSEEQAFTPSVPYDQFEETTLKAGNQNKAELSKGSYNQKKTVKLPFPSKPLKRRPTRTRKLHSQSFRNR